MSSAILVCVALALVCAALALLLWQRGTQRKGQASVARYIDSRMASAASPAGAAAGGVGGIGGISGTSGGAAAGAQRAPRATAAAAAARASSPLIAPTAPSADADWRERAQYLYARARFTVLYALTRAGLADAKGPLTLGALLVLALCGWAALAGGLMAFCATLAVCAMGFYFLLTIRAAKRRQQIVRQLPLFLDGIVRLITLGNSVPAAFQAALQSTEAPLRDCLDYVSRMLRTGVEIDRALSQVAAIYGVRELELVGAVLRLSVKYGGRADVMLDRMASFMRDLEQAERELVAMSAETRLSSWVLAMLPVGIGGFLILSNPKYFASMWFDPSGRQLVYLAFGLQLVGAYLLYRMTRLRD
ncbi:type II secretion system F family protein [Paraburkholderia sp. MMS20-SJTR3]|uniref:Type II secretion system F family protein n=1 Tax=Paraburkholderia sejongensis TaxID=2886946 RepID=A0ABS8JMQ5_9BURK|nr:type II secretion system F family protein [Paraburkholderia sp. MMS20-SJTR3]MCC8391172.1 type II secretion system F family protein [Paraburkholderia sp. MMS20-SJTR3]